ncbi:MAG: SEC-C metal-binding domain-containing protein [Clostridia bacterium]|nr:SEC-C metal-binding domain-containing protein [Clostridia bacterium]
MTLYEQWLSSAYYRNGRNNEALWNDYIPREQKIYEDIIENKKTELKGTVKELAETYNVPTPYIIGFIDGINETQDTPFELEKLEEDTEVTIKIDFVRLYKKMVEYKADHLYSLPQWSNIFSEEELSKLYKEQKKSTTIVHEGPKIGRNDPCPCGSGKKYKKCCGAK